MSKEQKIDQGCELTDDELDNVAGGGLVEPFVSRREGILIQVETFPREHSLPISLGTGFNLKG